MIALRRAYLMEYPSKHLSKLLGIPVDALRDYIEALFKPGMTRDNYDTYWVIGLIVPPSLFHLNEVSEQRLAYHYLNITPVRTVVSRQCFCGSWAIAELHTRLHLMPGHPVLKSLLERAMQHRDLTHENCSSPELFRRALRYLEHASL